MMVPTRGRPGRRRTLMIPRGYPGRLSWATATAPSPSSASAPTRRTKFITTYFRRAFVVEDPTLVTNLALGVVRDDGAVVYLNGTEVFRSNIPLGPVDYRTWASSEANGTDESTFFRTNVDPALLLQGTNVLAAEVHLASTNSPDWVSTSSSSQRCARRRPRSTPGSRVTP